MGYFRVPKSEMGNVITHGIALALSLCWLVILAAISWKSPSWIFWGCVLYGFTLSLTFAASVAYHAASDGEVKHLLRVIDHVTIFLMIAITHSTTMLVIPGVGLKWGLMGLIWAGVVLGIVLHRWLWLKAWTWRCEVAAVALYVFLGLLGFPVVGWDNLVVHRDWPVALLMLGGFTYLVGVVFYVLEDRQIFAYGHEVWHVICIFGAAFHTAAHGVVAWR